MHYLSRRMYISKVYNLKPIKLTLFSFLKNLYKICLKNANSIQNKHIQDSLTPTKRAIYIHIHPKYKL